MTRALRGDATSFNKALQWPALRHGPAAVGCRSSPRHRLAGERPSGEPDTGIPTLCSGAPIVMAVVPLTIRLPDDLWGASQPLARHEGNSTTVIPGSVP